MCSDDDATQAPAPRSARLFTRKSQHRLTISESIGSVQPGQHGSAASGSLEKMRDITIPKAVDLFRRTKQRHLVINGGISAAVTALVLYAFPDEWNARLAGSSFAVAVLGSLLSFAIVFRTQACYSRWWEARILWGQMVAAIANAASQGMLWFGDGKGGGLAKEFMTYCVIFPYACKATLRGNLLDEEPEEGQRFLRRAMLTEEELTFLMEGPTPPFVCVDVMRGLILESFKRENGCNLPSSVRQGAFLALEKTLYELVLAIGGCLRIKSTKMPASYTIYMRSCVIFYLILASFVWAPTVHWLTPFLVAFVTFFMDFVIVIGNQMMSPFDVQWSGLPLQKLCVFMEREVTSCLDLHDE
ncbi:hypothetical protein ACHAWF_000891 [Thalassiosira exigua]